MEASLTYQNILCYHRLYTEQLRQEETQDTIVPDRLPDIASELTVMGNVLIRSKDISAGRVRLELAVPVKLSYYAENGMLCTMEVSIPMFVGAENPEIPEGGKCMVTLTLTELRARALNPRKLTVTAAVGVSLAVYGAGEERYAQVQENSACPVHALMQTEEISAVCAVTEKTFVLTDEFILPENTGAEELLGQEVRFSVEELRFLGKKVILRGVADSFLLYRGTEMQTEKAEFQTAFSQIMDLETEEGEQTGNAVVLATGMYFDIAPGFDGRTVKMELHAVAQLRTAAVHRISYPADAYSNAYPLELNREEREVCCRERSLSLTGAVQMQTDLPQSVTELFGIRAGVIGVTVRGKEVQVSAQFTLLCRDSQGRMAAFTRTCEQVLTAEAGDETALEPLGAALTEVTGSLKGGGAEVRATVSLLLREAQRKLLPVICGITYDEEAPLDLSAEPSLVIMKIKSSDDLWQAAKENHSTVASIVQTNGMEAWGEPWEKLVLIPRTT